MHEPERNRRLTYVKAADLDLWQCRPIDAIDVLDLRDRPVGRVDGIVIERDTNRPAYVAIRRAADDHRPKRFLVPVGDAWFDETARVIRIAATRRARIAFDPEAFEGMSAQEADEYERRILAGCCPEVGLHRDGRPAYARNTRFTCPEWLRPAVGRGPPRRS